MPNCTGSESMHASMRSSQGSKLVSLVEACKIDQNHAALQIGAYTAYYDGYIRRGRGPTIWELAFRHADSIGTLKAY